MSVFADGIQNSHLGLEEIEKTPDEARRVLKPSSSLHLLDFGGAKGRSDDFIARLHHRSERLQDNFGDRIPTLMREAGFADPTWRSYDEG